MEDDIINHNESEAGSAADPLVDKPKAKGNGSLQDKKPVSFHNISLHNFPCFTSLFVTFNMLQYFAGFIMSGQQSTYSLSRDTFGHSEIGSLDNIGGRNQFCRTQFIYISIIHDAHTSQVKHPPPSLPT